MVTELAALSPDTGEAILNTSKNTRSLLKRSPDLGAADVLYLAVDPILSELGWDMRNPKAVRRLSGSEIVMMSNGKSMFAVRAIPIFEDVPGKIDATSPDAAWVVVTNGLSWSIFHGETPDSPFKTAALDTAAKAKDALEVLALLSQTAPTKSPLDQAFSSETVEDDILSVIKGELAGSKEFIALVKSRLTGANAAVADDAVKETLSRIDISVADAVTSAPVAEAPAPAKPAKATTKTKKKAPAKTAKAPAKSAAKKTATEAAPAPAASAKPAAKAAKQPAFDPASAEWPKTATHAMRRKKTVAFIKHSAKTDETILLPGSYLVAEIGKSLNKQQIDLRHACEQDGSLVPDQGMLRVEKELRFANPRLAATFAAGTLVKDISAWTSKGGKEIKSKLTEGSKDEAPAETPPAAPASEPPAELAEAS